MTFNGICMALRAILFIGVFFYSLTNLAQSAHKGLKKIAVFPVLAKDLDSGLSDEIWWQIRSQLTQDTWFEVAGRRLMVNRGVFHPRSNLVTRDVIFLADILEADALICLFVKDFKVQIHVYDGSNGLTLWKSVSDLDPLRKLSAQIPEKFSNLITEFIAAIPYQGVSKIDALDDVNGTLPNEDGQFIAVEWILNSAQIQIGDEIEWVEIFPDLTAPSFQGGSKINVLAEGIVIKKDDSRTWIKLGRTRVDRPLANEDLVRVKRMHSIQEEKLQEKFRPAMNQEKLDATSQTELKPNLSSTSLWTLLGLVGFLLLAF